MDKYEVIGLLGEGSFGRVYKAKQTSNNRFVAFKVISKRGRSAKELKALRRECEIQRNLHHPNIIQMLDSFETDNELVVITEFAHKELYVILGKEGYLPEERVQTIVWDLVSALYYLHSHRVLHRDLKPQNILLDENNTAKLCDFGFARNMSTGTHVLTSIKGTPLYMAPELIEEQPYDHNADLWSLGCIIYELLVGAPPFCTASILHLIRLIRHEQIQWPTFLSENCISFLRGLLQKNPNNRLSWPEILEHPFVKGHVHVQDDSSAMALTRPLSANTLQVKEQQRKHHVYHKTSGATKIPSSKSTEDVKAKETSKIPKVTSNSNVSVNESCVNKEVLKNSGEENTLEDLKNISIDSKSPVPAKESDSVHLCNFNFQEDTHPLEGEEWVAFLLKTIKEVLAGDCSSLLQSNFMNIILIPLKNVNIETFVIGKVVILLSSPYISGLISNEILEQIQKVYLEVKVIPNLLYCLKLTMRKEQTVLSTSSSSPSVLTEEIYKSNEELVDVDLQAVDYIFLIIARLVAIDNEFLSQFCDSVVVFKIQNLLHQFLFIYKQESKITANILAILSFILQNFPENYNIVEKIVLIHPCEDLVVKMLKHSDYVLKERTCCFLAKLVCIPKILEIIWNREMRDTLESLIYDSHEGVRNNAERTVDELKKLKLYYSEGKTTGS